MIDSSLIAGAQPTGVAGLLLAGGTGAAPIAGAGSVGAAGAVGGLVGDGFRERFEASAGLVPLASEGRTVLAKDGSLGVVPTASGEAKVAGVGVSTGLAGRGALSTIATVTTVSEVVPAQAKVSTLAETGKVAAQEVGGGAAGSGDVVASGVEESVGRAAEGVRQAMDASGRAQLALKSAQTEGSAGNLASAPHAAREIATVTITNMPEAAGRTGDVSGFAAKEVKENDAAGGLRSVVKTAHGAVAAGSLHCLGQEAPVEADLPWGSSGAILVGSDEASVAVPASARDLKAKPEASDQPVAVVAEAPVMAAGFAAKASPVGVVKEAGSSARSLPEGDGVAAVAGGKRTGHVAAATKSAGAAIAGKGDKQKAEVGAGDAPSAGLLASSSSVGWLPLPEEVAIPVAVDAPLAPREGVDRDTSGTTPTIVGAAVGLSAVGGRQTNLSPDAEGGASGPPPVKDGSHGVESPLVRPQAGDATGFKEGLLSTPQRLELRGDVPPVTAKRGALSFEPALAPDETGASAPVDVPVNGAHGAEAGLQMIAENITASTEVAQPIASMAAVEASGAAITERQGPAAKAVLAAREIPAASVSPATPVAGTAPTVQIPGVRADAPAAAAKVAGDAWVGSKAPVVHAESGTAQSGIAAVVAPLIHEEVLGDAKSAAAALHGQTLSARTGEYPGMTSAGEGMSHTTLVATPNVLEVGVASGTNGWLKVRAEMDGTGGVSASVVTTTASAAEALHKELPSLSAYLRDESVGVSSLVVNRTEGSAMTHDATASFGAGSSGAGSQAGRGGQPGAGETPTVQEPVAAGIEPAVRAARLEPFQGTTPGAAYGTASGGWLNVVA